MKTKSAKKMSAFEITIAAILTALVIILQFLGAFIRFGPFSVSLVLIPIVIGAALCGKYIGAWLGFVFGAVVLLNGDAAAFLTVNVPGTIITVLLKGTLCGFAAGLTYSLISKANTYVGVVAAAVVCPVVNTGVFLLGCIVFFLDTITKWGAAVGFGENVVNYMLLGLAGGNFLFELALNILLCPLIMRLIKLSKKL